MISPLAVQASTSMDPFSFWWQLPGEWVEPPNQRRGGWSGVLRSKWHNRNLYIKRQTHHLCRDWRHPQGWPTLCREHRNLLQLQRLGIGCPAQLFNARSGDSAVLVLEALEGFTALDQLTLPCSEARRCLAHALGHTLGRLHRHHLQHGCLYDKHVFVREQAGTWHIALIDLEKMRWRSRRQACAQHDLSQLQRHQHLFDHHDWQRLLDAHAQALSQS